MTRGILSDIFSPSLPLKARCVAMFVALYMAGAAVVLLVLLVDEFATIETTVVVIEAKEVIPASTTFVILDTTTVIPHHQPESYRIHFRIESEELSLATEKKLFDNIKAGDEIEIDYRALRNSHKPIQARLLSR